MGCEENTAHGERPEGQPEEICPGDSKPCWVGTDDDGHWRCGTVQCGQKELHSVKPQYECRCAECERPFIAESKHRILCPSCKRITAADTNECPDCGRVGCQINH